MIKLIDLLKETIDIYKPDELESKGIKYKIKKDNSKEFLVNIEYQNNYYYLRIGAEDIPIPHIDFGIVGPKFKDKDLNFDDLINSPSTPRMLAAIFGLVRYWVDKHNIKEIGYDARTEKGNLRNKLYDYYLKKHFSDFEQIVDKRYSFIDMVTLRKK